MKKIHAFLSGNRHEAFSENEIRIALKEDVASFEREWLRAQGLPADATPLGLTSPIDSVIHESLIKLGELWAVEARDGHGQTYFAYSKELPDLR